MSKFVTNSLEVSKRFKKRHVDVCRILKPLIKRLENLPEGDKLYPIVEYFDTELEEQSYRGQKFEVYLLTKEMAILLSARISTPEAIEYIMTFVVGHQALKNKIEELVTDDDKSMSDIGRSLIMLHRINYSAPMPRERIYVDEIVCNFHYIFPEYKMKGREVLLADEDKIDILAEEISTHRPVIIEAKVADKPVHKQLRSYAYHFDNPILVGIAPVDISKKTDDIIYVKYDG